MNTENEMNEEVRQLLDSLEEHGKNARRQQDLSDLIDQLSEKELGTGTSLRGTKQSRKQVDPLDCFVVPPRNDAKRRKLYPLWWAMGAAAACLLLWLLVKPNAKQQPEMEQEILVEETKAVDSVKTEVNDVVFERPIANETFLAEETPVVPQNASMKKEKPKTQIIEEVVEQPMLAEVKPTETKDTTNIGSNTIPTENETPSAVQKPQRKVIRSLNLVCYECRKEPEPEVGPKPNVDNRTLFGQPQDPNMKNGALAFEFKLN
ncbi:MAG: hypothetical protein K6G25_02300 [Bacteroidales bacterium]|nr:hypothetical protein [Bacteroidales bacterium]